MRRDNRNRLWEYVLHPLQTLQGIHRYRRQPEVRNQIQKTFKQQQFDGRNWLNQYFDTMYGTDRINLYIQYKEMDFDPLVMAVLERYAEACSQPNSENIRDEMGRVVWVHTKNKKIHTILTDFLDKIQIDQYAFAILRNMIHYGDHFEAIPAVRNEGIEMLVPYDAWTLATIWDNQRRVIGFTQSDERGEPINRDFSRPYWEFLHFRMRQRYRTSLYGATSSSLFNIREYWQELQWVEDKLVIERLRRSVNRFAILLDVGGMSAQDSYSYFEEVKNMIYRDHYFDPNTPDLSSLPPAWGEQRDVVIPSGGDNNTSITTLPGTGSTGSLDDLDFFLRRFFGGLKFPPAYLGLELGGGYDRSVPLEKQDVAFSQACMGPQRAFLGELTRACMIHLAYLNIDARQKGNHFSLMATPISAYQEMERKDLLNMRYDILERAMAMGRDNGWNMDVWTRYVMVELARMPEEFVEILLNNPQAAEPETGPDNPNFDLDQFSLSDNRKKSYSKYMNLMEYLEKNPDVKKALNFYQNGGSTVSSRQVGNLHLPFQEGGENYSKAPRLDEGWKKRNRVSYSTTQLADSDNLIQNRPGFDYQTKLKSHISRKVEVRKGMFKEGLSCL